MKVLGLISGGKDSCYNLLKCVEYGHEIVALANLYRQVDVNEDLNEDSCEESYMYQTVGHEGIEMIAKAMKLPLFRAQILGVAVNKDIYYKVTAGDETEDLFNLIQKAKQSIPDIEAVSSGAILSTYQRTRVENVCKRLELFSLAFLWHRPQLELLSEIIDHQIEAVIIKVAGMGLKRHHVGMSLGQIKKDLISLNSTYDLHPCGEGGEYETFVVDCPLYRKKIVFDNLEIHSIPGDVYFATFKPVLIEKIKQDYIPKRLDFLDPFFKSIQNIILDYQKQGVGFNNLGQKKISGITLDLENTPQGSFEACRKTSKFLYTHLLNISLGQGDLLKSDLKDQFKNVICDEIIQTTVILREGIQFSHFYEAYNQLFSFLLPPAHVCIRTRNQQAVFDIQIWVLCVSNYGRERKGIFATSINDWCSPVHESYSQSIEAENICVFSSTFGIIPRLNRISTDISAEIAIGLQNLYRNIFATRNLNTLAAIVYTLDASTVPVILASWNYFIAYLGDFFDDIIIIEVESLPNDANIQWQVYTSSLNLANSTETTKISIETQFADDESELISFSKSMHSIIYTGNMEKYMKINLKLFPFVVPVKSIWNKFLNRKKLFAIGFY